MVMQDVGDVDDDPALNPNAASWSGPGTRPPAYGHQTHVPLAGPHTVNLTAAMMFITLTLTLTLTLTIILALALVCIP